MSNPTTSERPRRRVRIAYAALARVQAQRDRFTATYAIGRTAQARFNTAADALRAAAAERLYRDDPVVTSWLDEITTQITTLVDELHEQQEQHARHVLRADQLRHERNGKETA